jgi:hypothetical protein
MVPVPTLLELVICELVIVEQGSGRVSKINSINDLSAGGFPYDPGRFCVYAVLTGSVGKGDVMLQVTHLPTDQEVYAWMDRIEFVDRFEEVQVLVEPSAFAYPQPGEYLFALYVDADLIASRRVHVY